LRKLVLSLAILFHHSFCAIAQSTLSGNIGGMVFESMGNPYVIVKDIMEKVSGFHAQQAAEEALKQYSP
jgi:hypothetical protein